MSIPALHLLEQRPKFQNLPRLRFGLEVTHKPITLEASGQHVIPPFVRIPFIEGDGIGPEIMQEAQKVVNAAVKAAYQKERAIEWIPMIAGEKSLAMGQDAIPQQTVDTIKSHYFFVKGPLNTPIGKGFRSINVQLRKMFDLFACVRPIKVFQGVVTPMKQDRTDIVLFRENTEDVYCGVEFPKDSIGAKILIWFLNTFYKAGIRQDSAIGIKPISEFASKRLVESAIRYALKNNRPSVTLVHKGNIMKDTEGAFAQWGKEVAQEKFPGQVLTNSEFKTQYGADFKKLPAGKIVLQERLTDAKFQDLILNPHWDSVIATMNLNGDYLSDAYAGTVGGLGISPGANIGDQYAMFESTHGSAPDIAGKNIANSTALMLTMVMMLRQMKWCEAADLMTQAIENTLKAHKMTGDLAKYIPGGKALSTTEYTEAVLESLQQIKPSKEIAVA